MKGFAMAAVLTVAALGLMVAGPGSLPVWAHSGDHGGNGHGGGGGGSDKHPGNNSDGNGNQGGKGSHGVHGNGACVQACMNSFRSCQSDALSAFKACFQPCAALHGAIAQACGQGDGVTGSQGESEGERDGVTGSEGHDDGDTEPEGDGVTNTGPSAACEQAIQAFQDCADPCQADFRTTRKGCLQGAHMCFTQCGIPPATAPGSHH